MGNAFQEVYGRLNAAQRQAVDTLEGPVLVIAGPGTGKTQLLSARVANILHRTDTPAQNILCLTFTESGAANMRERLTRFIGQSAYDVTIGTYHAFGGDLIQRYPEYFNETRLQTPIDDLTRRQILQKIVEAMRYDNPLKQSRHHLGDLMASIGEIKRALLDADQLQAVATENIALLQNTRNSVADIFKDFTRMPGIKKALPYFEQLATVLEQHIPKNQASPFGSMARLARSELDTALEAAESTQKTTPLTVWKNKWLAKDGDNKFIIAGEIESRRIAAMADVLEQYQAALAEKGLYDFDDMILRAIQVLEKNADLKYTLQEKYLYILLDEFQDTNAAQLKLIQLLTDNPVHEGRPNILAVGDDDQAIYAFQGAQYSNMLDFLRAYRNVTTINLTENYRSRAEILETAGRVAEQIESRLSRQLPDMAKQLTAANPTLPDASIERRSFKSPIAERDWVARRIEELIGSGIAPHEIAVLAPKHKYLEPLVPYLNARAVPVRYEKREDILKAQVVKQLIIMSKLVIALQQNNQETANALWPEALSYDCWNIPVEVIWRLSWRVADGKNSSVHWSRAAMDEPATKPAALLMLGLAAKAGTEDLETMLDYLTGTIELSTHDPGMPAVRSPLREFCCSDQVQSEQPELFLDTVSHLAVLRAKLHEYQNSFETALMLPDFVAFVELYEDAEQQITNTSPYNQQADSVQLMTVFKAKGLEYEHVFLIHCEDEVWGSLARGNSNKLTLPPNLAPIRYAGANDDERLRLLFVAITRARYGLYLSSSAQNYSGRSSTRLKYFDERQEADDSVSALILPENFQKVIKDDSEAPTLELLQLDWRTRHLKGLADVSLKSLLAERLENYQLSPTHLISFIDLEYAGPRNFFLHRLLGLPEAPTLDDQYGIAVHETLEWLQHRVSENSFLPDTADVLSEFRSRVAARKLTAERAALEIIRGEKALQLWLKTRQQIFARPAIVERNFKHEGVFVGEAHMSGRIDRMEIDEKSKTITVVDYKTGKCYDSWKNDIKLHKYRLQLYCYKLLIENSRTYKSYKVESGRLEFIEPDDFGKINTLDIRFDDQEMTRVRQLIESLWRHVHELNFPETSQFPATLKGIQDFESALLRGDI